MANTKHPNMRRTRRKLRYPFLITDTDFHDNNMDDCRYGPYHTDLESSYSDSQVSDVQQQENDILDQCSSGPQDRLLSDHHASIDVLTLEREMKTVLTNLEKFGILEDDYKSLALTNDEEEKVDDSVKTWPALALHIQESNLEDIRNDDGENDWEVLSSADSVWTVETFAEERSFRDVLLDNTPFTMTCGSAHFNGEPTIHTVPVEMMPPISYNPHRGPPKQMVNLEMLERADVWSSIRDSIRGFGARYNAGDP